MHTYNSHTDEYLLSLLKDGDEAAFTAIYHRYWQQLLYVAHKRLQDTDNSKEVVQAVFLKLWEKRTSLNIQSLPVYLAAMTRHAVYRHWANHARRTAQMKVVQAQLKVSVSEPLDLENKQLIDILAKFANELPEKYRIVFISHKLLDRPLEEVAAQLGVSTRTAEGYVSKLMEIMRNHREKIAFSFIVSSLL